MDCGWWLTVIVVVFPHFSDVIMTAMSPQITGVPIVQRKHQSSASLAFCEGKSPVTVTGRLPSQRVSDTENVFYLLTSSWTPKCAEEWGNSLQIGQVGLIQNREPKQFFQEFCHFCLISDIHWTLKMTCVLAYRGGGGGNPIARFVGKSG